MLPCWSPKARCGSAAEDWTDRLLALAARVEAQLDFADEDDVTLDTLAPITAALLALADEMDLTLATPPVERLRDGVRVVIAGPPNSGKSTLLNALAERDAAIVSPISGTDSRPHRGAGCA